MLRPRNASAQRPEGKQREPPVRWSAMLGRSSSLNDLIRSDEHRWRNGQPEGLRGSEIDRELELRRLFDRKVGRLGAS